MDLNPVVLFNLKKRNSREEIKDLPKKIPKITKCYVSVLDLIRRNAVHFFKLKAHPECTREIKDIVIATINIENKLETLLEGYVEKKIDEESKSSMDKVSDTREC